MQIHPPYSIRSKELKDHSSIEKPTEKRVDNTSEHHSEKPHEQHINKANNDGTDEELKVALKKNELSLKDNKMDGNPEKKGMGMQEKNKQIPRLVTQEYATTDSIDILLKEIGKNDKYSIIENPDQLLQRTTSIHKILVSTSVSDTQKIIYHILPIRFAPLKGKLRILRQKMSYHSIHTHFESELQKFEVESTILKDVVFKFAEFVEKLREGLSIKGEEIRCIAETLKDPISIDVQSTANSKTIAYRYKGIPATIIITPIVIYTGPLDIDLGERMIAKKIESIGLYFSTPENLRWTLEYILKKKKKAMESPVSMIIKKDADKINDLKALTTKIFIAAHLIFQLIAIPLSVLGILPAAIYYILFIIIICASLFSFFSMGKVFEQRKPTIQSEKDLFKRENKKYLDLHLKWMNKEESIEFKTQLVEEYKLMAIYYESLRDGTMNTNANKRKKSVLQYIDTRDVSKDRILEQFQALSRKQSESKRGIHHNTAEKSNEHGLNPGITNKNNDQNPAVISSPMKIEPASEFTSDSDTIPISNAATDGSQACSKMSQASSEVISEPAYKGTEGPSSGSQASSKATSNAASEPNFASNCQSQSFIEFESKDLKASSIEANCSGEYEQKTDEKNIFINLESGSMSNLGDDLLDSIKEFLNL